MLKKTENSIDSSLVCPECSSTNISGLMASFWVRLNSSGEPKSEWREFESCTGLEEERMCDDCGYEF